MSRLVKAFIRWLTRNILKIRLGTDSYLSIPYVSVTGGSYIELGERSTIGKMAWLSAINSYKDQHFTPCIKIGADVTIGNYFCLTAIDNVSIANGCLISEHVYISDHGHGTDPNGGPPVSQPLYSKGSVYIGENTFLGYRVSILPGVHLGRNCVVGAHSVVTHSFPDYCVVAGVPARLLKQYNPQTQTWHNAAIRA
ncbi:acyltransferase [Spirosoma sp. HMF3257]|uniref:Acyltransferase n=1 Tax=Spirosoma telluris TaxID=2183553 RepID=A0A327NTN5_9BACT|nr:acyltransferase [Spirosoma telluris]RAI76098.1 acyltransferase [Spirosoma telluris]